MRPAEAHDLFNYLSLRVDLHRINAAVRSLVPVFFNGVVEGVIEFVDAAAQNVGEAQKERQSDAPQRFQIDGVTCLIRGRNQHVAGLADAEVTTSPIFDAVRLGCIRQRPRTGEGRNRL